MNFPTDHSTSDSTNTMEQTEEEKDHNFEESGTLRARKHVTSACFPCKNGKVKCDGQRPCARCLIKDVDCTYRSDEDGRSRIPMKRRIERLEHDNATLRQLLNQIRGANGTQVQQIASLIRSDASLDEVNDTLQQVKENAVFAGSPVDPMIDDICRTTGRALSYHAVHGTSVGPSTSQPSFSPELTNRALSIHRLIDEPPYKVPAAPWTTVTTDNDLVSHLTSMWATWYHLLPDGVVLEPFLRSMRAAKIDSIFCSPFLVNCVLAAGCLFSDFDEAKTVRGKTSDMMSAFVKEAIWHLGRDQSTPSITNVQGLGILYVLICQLNQDRDGYHYAVAAATMGDELFRVRERILAATSTRPERDELAFVLDSACWGIYSMTTASMSAWMRPQPRSPPQTPIPRASSVNTVFHATVWSPYPRHEISQDIHLDDSLRQHYKLAMLTAELTDEMYARVKLQDLPSRVEVLQDIHVRLIFWHERLPEYMKQASPGCLSVTMLLMWYHGIVMTLLKAKIESYIHVQAHRESEGKDNDRHGNEDGRGDEIDTSEEGSVDSDLVADLQKDEGLLAQHALRITHLLSSNRDTYGYSRLHCFMCQPGHVALYALVQRNADNRYDAEITELLTAMRAMSRRFPFTFTLLRMMQLDLRLRHLELPASTEKLFDEYEQLDGAAWQGSGPSNSMYPSPQLSVGPYPDEKHFLRGARNPTNMIEFLKVFDGLKIS